MWEALTMPQAVLVVGLVFAAILFAIARAYFE
jgi:hypothetical protein